MKSLSAAIICDVRWFILNSYRFLHELAQIPNFAERAQCIIFRSVFSEGITAVHRKVEIITRASKVCLLCNSKTALPSLGVKEGVGTGKDQLESLCRNIVDLRLCVFLSITVTIIPCERACRWVKKKETQIDRGERGRKKTNTFTDFFSRIPNTSQCTFWPLKTNLNSIVCFPFWLSRLQKEICLRAMHWIIWNVFT